jgi:hypothetical protein
MNHKMRKMREQTCGEKVRYKTRVDARVGLHRSLPAGQIERMHPYACKFCYGWHNGHERVEAFLEWEARCSVCGHAAMAHDSGLETGLGCAYLAVQKRAVDAVAAVSEPKGAET